jgi:hypothetical protein
MRRKPRELSDPEWGLYCCSGCGELLQLERVLSAQIERHEGVATGYIVFRHYCPCVPDVARISRRWGSYPSFLVLFGAMPDLPYESSFDWHPVPDDDPSVVRWRWELAKLFSTASTLTEPKQGSTLR